MKRTLSDYGRKSTYKGNMSHKVYERPFNPKRRPAKSVILNAAKRFARDGEKENAINLVRLVYPDSKQYIREALK